MQLKLPRLPWKTPFSWASARRLPGRELLAVLLLTACSEPPQPGVDIVFVDARAFTLDAAYQLHMEDEIGSLEVGKKADLVVLDKNLFESDPYGIHRAKVVMTLMDGEIVYRSMD